MTDLGTLGGSGSIGFAVDERGRAVGQAGTPDGERHAVLWENGAAVDLGTLGGDQAYARSINGAGWIVGASTIGGAEERWHAVLWADGKLLDLNALIPTDSGWELGRAFGINDRGQIVGSGRLHGVARGFLLTPIGAGTPAVGRSATPSAATPAAAGREATPVPAASACAERIAAIPERTTWELRGDCTTDAPIAIPDGWTFDGRGHSIRVVDPLGGRFHGAAIEANGGTAIVRDVTIDGSGLSAGCSPDAVVAGISFAGARGEISGATVVDVRRQGGAGCGTGIRVSAGADVAVSGNRVSGGSAGIAVGDEGTSARVVGNTLDGVLSSGIRVDAATVTAAGNTITGVRGTSIFVSGGATVQIRDNEVTGSVYGIGVRGAGTSGTISGNTVRETTREGIVVAETADATIVGNTVLAAGDNGIEIQNSGTRATVDGNTVEDAGGHGILLAGRVLATITGNTVTGAGDAGISAQSGAVARVTGGNRVSGGRFGIVVRGGGTGIEIADNTIQGAADDGLVVEAAAGATVTRNNVVGAGDVGILILTGERVNVTDNTVTGPDAANRPENRPTGIRFVERTSGVVDGNAVAGFFNEHPEGQACGIHVPRDVGRIEVGANRFPAPGNEADLCRDGQAPGGEAGESPVPDQGTPTTGPAMGASPAAVSPGAPAELTVVSIDIAFEPAAMTIPAGTDITVVLPNNGAMIHNFSIDELGISVDIARGTTERTTINAPVGEYEYYCDVPGHKAAGMVGTLTVE